MKKEVLGVIVLGGHVQGLGIIRIYGENGIPCILFDDTPYNIARFSKYCESFFNYKSEFLKEFLIDFQKNIKYKDWLLVPTNDLQVRIISENIELLSGFYKISTDKWPIVEKCYNKRLTYRIAKRLNIPIPNTWMPNSEEELLGLNIPTPCIIKPAVVHSFYKKAKQKVFHCKNAEELLNNYRKAIKIIPFDEVIVQEIILGANENQYSIGIVYNRNESLVSLMVRRKRQHPIDFGNATTFAETVDIPEAKALAEKLLTEINYRGICEVEFKYDSKDNIFKLLEINPRTWKWHIIAKKSNSPLLMSLYNLVYDRSKIIKHTQEPASFKHQITDIPTVIRMKLKNSYIQSNNRNTISAVWDIKDPLPGIVELFLLPFLIFKR